MNLPKLVLPKYNPVVAYISTMSPSWGISTEDMLVEYDKSTFCHADHSEVALPFTPCTRH